MNTKSIIEELYYGNVHPSERSIRRGSTFDRTLALLTQSEDSLSETLTQAQKETFNQFKDRLSELNSINEVTAFSIGFKLDLQLTAEALLSIKTDTEPLTE